MAKKCVFPEFVFQAQIGVVIVGRSWLPLNALVILQVVSF